MFIYQSINHIYTKKLGNVETWPCGCDRYIFQKLAHKYIGTYLWVESKKRAIEALLGKLFCPWAMECSSLFHVVESNIELCRICGQQQQQQQQRTEDWHEMKCENRVRAPPVGTHNQEEGKSNFTLIFFSFFFIHPPTCGSQFDLKWRKCHFPLIRVYRLILSSSKTNLCPS